ncbi:EAL domain-containing protein [Aquincola sp. MAHUQ-54]|uniref:EAL domain-containing protein n=2 Tax=Aquincola TaxID=391952 RepID=A0AAW9QIR5_9BURK
MLARLLDELPMPVSFWDAELRCRHANPRLREWYGGLAPSQMIGRRLPDAMGPDAWARHRDCVDSVLDGRPASYTGRRPHPHGGFRDISVELVPHRREDGALDGFFILIDDTTERLRTLVALAESESRYRAFVEDQTELLLLAEPDGTLTMVNPAYARHVGLAAAALVGTSLYDRVGPQDREALRAHLTQLCRGGGTGEFENRIIAAGGEMRWVSWTNRALLDESGRVNAIHSVGRDVTDRRRAEDALAEEHELLRVTLASIGDAVITTDHQGRVRWLNPVAERVTACTSAAAQGSPLDRVFSLVDEDSGEPVEDLVGRCLAQARVVAPAQRALLRTAGGAEYGVEASAAPIRRDGGEVLGVVLVFRDVTQQRRLTREMSHRAKHDDLTGLVNRTEFEARLRGVLDTARQHRSDHALMYIDLDQFKLVNDACGHAVGDQLLRQLTTVLQGCVRNRDTLARLGGDEFGVILEHCTAAQAQRVAQTICDRMEGFRFVHEGRKFRVGTSIGLVPVDWRWPHTGALLQAADSACYAAKEAGRNRVHAWVESDQTLQLRRGEMQWASRIEQALDEDRFDLFAQCIEPIAEPSHGLHIEVLLRLREADGTLVAPGAFLPAAERFHLASRIDRWVVRRVFEWMAAHDAALGHVETVAINLSGQSIGDRAFHAHVAALVQQFPFDVRRLCFEITETAAITSLADATAFIDTVRALGARIALDDFGAGASSFGYLKTLPVDYLKIDGQFVRDVLDDPLDRAAVRCFHEVAGVVGVKTIAEFVENDAVLAELRSIGIDFAQGYGVHRPEPLQGVVERARERFSAAPTPAGAACRDGRGG